LNCLKRLVRRPLLIAVLLLVIVLLAFGGVLQGVITAGSILVIDTNVDRLLASHRQPIATELFLCFTFLGKGPVIAASALAAGALFLVLGRRNYVVPLALTLGGAEGSVQLLKRAVGRVRPNPDLAYYVERSFSFPSAHATLAAAFYGFLAYAIVQEAQPAGLRRAGTCAMLLMALGIGLSRVYLGVHYLSDVLGGYLLGLAWPVIGATAAATLRPHAAANSSSGSTRR
jgi:membrane-associated phospholipid phosphatase